jgi:hypothetical protein
MRITLFVAAIAAIVPPLCARVTTAQQVRQFEKDGVVYQESRQTERTPVSSVQWQQRQETVYVQQPTTEVCEYQRTVYWPVVRYQCEPRWHGLLNPFTGPYIAYHMRPVVQWQARNETVQTPLTYQQWVPQTRIVKTPVRSLGFVEQERVTVARVAPSSPTIQVASPPAPAPTVVVEHFAPMTVTGRPIPVPPAVGVRRMEGDPPRAGSTTVLR